MDNGSCLQKTKRLLMNYRMMLHMSMMKGTCDNRRLLMLIINAMEELKKVSLLSSKHEKMYWILFYTYLTPREPMSMDEVIEMINKLHGAMSRDSYYRLKRLAIRMLSGLIFRQIPG